MAKKGERTRAERIWDEIWASYHERTTAEIRVIPYSAELPDQTEAAKDLGVDESYDHPLPPYISVSDDIDAMLEPYTSRLNKTKGNLLKRRFKALVGEWFQQYARDYCPEDTSHLRSSYNQIFEAGLQSDQIVIASDVWYAGYVEEMEDVEWKKGSAKDHFAASASDDIRDTIPEFIDESWRFATS